ncbi:hypothetical protein CFP56_013283 [Quercus suber]|uniref:Uncharacterized protein n=1 Tax=Quercus suber TaxID=58331 RepID=A0AAW0KU16_QUESU
MVEEVAHAYNAATHEDRLDFINRDPNTKEIRYRGIRKCPLGCYHRRLIFLTTSTTQPANPNQPH